MHRAKWGNSEAFLIRNLEISSFFQMGIEKKTKKKYKLYVENNTKNTEEIYNFSRENKMNLLARKNTLVKKIEPRHKPNSCG